MATVRLSEWSDVSTLASNLREADRAELEALGSTPYLSLAHGFIHSDPPFTIVDQDQPVGMFGVVPLSPDRGVIWLLGTDALVEGAKWDFLRTCRYWVKHLQRRYEVLTNIVDVRNLVHIRWLSWCGFEFIAEHNINNHPFIQFERRAQCAIPSPSP